MPSLFPDRGVVWGDEEDLSGVASEEVTFGRSWRFDYDVGDFVMESEIARMVSETLLADPRTESVDQFTFNWNLEQCMFSCRVASVQEEMFILESEVI